MTHITRRLALAAAGLLAAPAVLRAQGAYPNRPIRLIVPFPGGGSTDLTARIIAERISSVLGQPVVVDNRPGAGGNIGADVVAKSEPDGHTLLMCTIGTATINQFLYSRMPFDAQKDLTAVAMVNLVTNGIVASPNVKAKNVQELIALAKERKGELTFATPGNGTSGHLTGEYFKARTGAELTHVPYRGTGSLLPDLMSNRVDLSIDNLPTYLPYLREGKVRLIAVTSKARWAPMPDVPTVIEGGIPDFESVAWFGLQAPSKTPRPIIEKLSSTIGEQMKDQALLSRLREAGTDPNFLGSADFAKFIQSEDVKWREVVRVSGAKLD
ncbi:tripartite tricarboxylate transporter substrate binding protein [Acetobacteraceae bacterium H6797]|nr:tripartite tricarboxylate transporter substrate binding protein [Acetobacteraceae bacterium H6797]